MFLASDSTLRPTFDSSSKLFLNLGKMQITWYAVIILGGAIICSLIAYYRYLKRMGMSIDTLREVGVVKPNIEPKTKCRL